MVLAGSPDWRSRLDSPADSLAESGREYHTPCAFVPEATPMFSPCASTPAVSLLPQIASIHQALIHSGLLALDVLRKLP